jgi:MOSC domain-containing protein
MRGEMLPSLAIDTRGVVGDRVLALRDGEGKLGSGKTNKRFRQIDGLLGFVAETRGGAIVIRFPDGREMAADDPAVDRALSDACGVAVTLAREAGIAHRDAAPVHLLSEASLAWLRGRLSGVAIDARRFRPNLVIATDGAGQIEQGWIDRVLAIGAEVTIRIAHPTVRCVMTTLQQAELGAAPAILRTLASDSAASLGVYAEVLHPGTVRIGDALRFA